jgi:molybdate/tungstate transport system substrate-binding protein
MMPPAARRRFIESRAGARALLAVVAACLLVGCGGDGRSTERAARRSPGPGIVPLDTAPRLLVLHAGSLAGPMRAALDSFTARTGVRVATMSAGSLEAARRITELHDVPDIIALADEEVFPSLLMPDDADGYFVFARNRMVIAVAPRRARERVDSTNWYRALSDSLVEVARSDPDLDPAGYRALLVLQLAARAYHMPSLPQRVLARSGPENVRPKSSDLIALLETGVDDYAFVYESSARAAGLRWIQLPSSIDLGDESKAADYATVSVTVKGRTRGQTLTMRGAPIRYAMAVPRKAPHPAAAGKLAEYLLSDAGLGAMRAAGLPTVRPRYVGASPPAWLVLDPSRP